MAAKALFLTLAAATWVCLSAVAVSAFDVPSVAFEEGFSPLFGDENLVRSRDDRSVRLLLDRRSGSGFISSDYYLHGFFSASIKLPRDYTAGVVVAFYAFLSEARFFTPALTRPAGVVAAVLSSRWLLARHKGVSARIGFNNCCDLNPHDSSDDERASFSAWGESRGRRRGRRAGTGAKVRADVASS